MSNPSIVAVGLPSSGKTTFLAALWHVLTSKEITTKLSFGGLTRGDISYLAEISGRWRDAYVQVRTAVSGSRLVQLRLRLPSDKSLELTFPDAPGEDFRDMWERRQCSEDLLPHLQSENVILFIHADKIEFPRWIVDDNNVVAQFNVMTTLPDGEVSEQSDHTPYSNAKPWSPDLAPTQVQLVGLLQLLAEEPLHVGGRRLAIILSAWDLAADEGYTPSEFLQRKLPLLHQYLTNNDHVWTARPFGMSAQGSPYDKDEKAPPSEGAIRAREEFHPSNRVRVVTDDGESRDLTEPLYWLLEVDK